MRAARIERVKRRVLKEAVEENLDTIRGLPPRALRSGRRWAWARRVSLVLVPLSLAGSTWMISTSAGTPPAPALAAIAAPALPAAIAAADQPIDLPMAPPPVERVTASAFPLSVRRVVLDAGHGGSDPGAMTDDLLEKEITLDIGARLRTLLERDGFAVVVTRDADETVALRDRAFLANGSRSDIFVSIHVNSLTKHTSARGIETYYLGPTDDPSLTALAAAENRVSGYSMADMRRLLDGVYAYARGDESHQLASAVQQSLYTKLRQTDAALENWGVKRAPFIVLVATDMPAILAEVGCISNRKEAALLRTPEYRQKIADALFEGIRGYAGAGAGALAQKKGTDTHG